MTGYFVPADALAAIGGRVLFYPSAGSDWSEALTAFADAIDEFRFVDINYEFTGHDAVLVAGGYSRIRRTLIGPTHSTAVARSSESGIPYRDLEPAWFTERYERCADGRQFTVIRRRGFGQYAIRELADRSVGVFMHRGDSLGDGGSNTYYLANRRRDHEPLSNLFSKLAVKLADRALIISDGSNTRKRFINRYHFCTEIEGSHAYEREKDRTHFFGGFTWKCVGYLGNRYGPTLVWLIVRDAC